MQDEPGRRTTNRELWPTDLAASIATGEQVERATPRTDYTVQSFVAVMKEAIRHTGVGRLRWIRKAQNLHRCNARVRDNLAYLAWDPEVDNYSYDIANRRDLVQWCDELCGGGAYVDELYNDRTIRAELDNVTRWRPAARNQMHFARRLGWYAVVRTLEPQVVVETGMHDGLGSVALLAALDRNRSGCLVSIDPRPGTGWLVPARLRPRWLPLRMPSSQALDNLGRIDMLIHDSLHEVECETWELRTAARHGAAIIASDNARQASTFATVAQELGATPHYFEEHPLDHFFPGDGIGLAFLK